MLEHIPKDLRVKPVIENPINHDTTIIANKILYTLQLQRMVGLGCPVVGFSRFKSSGITWL